VSNIENILHNELQDFFTDNKNLNTKEAGHSMASQVEQKVVDILNRNGFAITKDVDKKGKQKERSYFDFNIKFNQHNVGINVKFNASQKFGQPNICSMNRTLDYFKKEQNFNSYYILKIRHDKVTKQISVCLADIFDYTHCLTFNSGTGQLMLQEKEFYQAYNNKQVKNLSHYEKIKFFYDLYDSENEKHIKLRIKQGNKRKQEFKTISNNVDSVCVE